MNIAKSKPVYLGGTVEEHVLFVVSLCRYQHHTVPLGLVHYVTWSVIGLALHSLALTIAGPLGAYGPIVLALALTAWAMRMDLVVGVFFGLMQAAYAWTTVTLVRAVLPSSWAATIVLALVAIVVAIATEVASHHVLQGYGPRPPARALEGLSRRQKMSFLPYFVVTFGVFFLTLDLAMRFLDHRRALHLRANELVSGWHEDAVGAREAAADVSREDHLHRRALNELRSA